MPRISLSQNGLTPFKKLLGHNVDVLNGWVDLENAFLSSTPLSPELLEQVRRASAWEHGCRY
jgi:hypothetical protein